MFKFSFALAFLFALSESLPLNETVTEDDFIWVIVKDAAMKGDMNLTENTNYVEERSSFNEPRTYAIGASRKVNWYTAQLLCASRGLTLASVNNAREAETLRNFVFQSEMVKKGLLFWTSGTDQAVYRDFNWFSNGRPLIFENWADGEPSQNGRCVTMNAFGEWTTNNCACPAYFICENRCAYVY